jgi:hypothetical protein
MRSFGGLGMAGAIDRIFSSIRGRTRIGKSTEPPPAGATPATRYDLEPSGERDSTPGTAAPAAEASWLAEVQKLVPGEALAGYIALQPIASVAENPTNVKIVLALAFLVVTIFLRWVGSQDPGSPNPAQTAELPTVVISALSFICLVYATGGQLFWHQPVPDQSLYGQIGALALGAVGPRLAHMMQRG